MKAGTRRGASGSSQSRDRGLKGGGRRAPGTIRVWVEAQDHGVDDQLPDRVPRIQATQYAYACTVLITNTSIRVRKVN